MAAGVTGAGIALPLLGATSANAVTPETWDAAAACESDGVWTANTGNGYYGGFQIPLAQWEAHGGTDFAKRPDLASRAQQITVAERMLAAQGKAAFPGCAVTTGLWQEYRAGDQEETDTTAEVPGATESGIGEVLPEEPAADTEDDAATGSGADPTQDAAADGATDKSTGKPADQATDETADGDTDGDTDADADERDDSSAADAGTDSGSGSGRHRGEAAPESDAQPGENTDGTGRHAERPADRDGERTDPATGEASAEDTEEVAEGDAGSGAYEVLTGDTLSEIADALTVDGGWPALYEANESVIGDNPDHIVPGLQLELGGKGA
ncbi:transglycosylase family protein [Streptomyces xiamenensis]